MKRNAADEPVQEAQMEETSLAAPAEASGTDDVRIEEASSKYLATWNHLVSTTNWEKGRIINEWRRSLQAVAASPSDYSDEVWSRRVGNVTPQHVGRLRRVYHRFHENYRQYDGLYWSHFQAALEWDDAEMWLEGAVQSGWSVATMRQSRWEAIGAPADQQPSDGDVIFAELDEDVSRADDSRADMTDENRVEVQDVGDGAPFDAEPRDDAQDDPSASLDATTSEPSDDGSAAPAEPIRPFEDMPSLPADLQEAVEMMKLAIVNHRLTGWKDVRCDDVLAALAALKQLALAPSDA